MVALAPTISIVTICLNSEAHIRDTLDSVRHQTRQPFEFIVIDGGSNDRTNEIIKEYDDVVSRHLSEPDDGIADAMNKGLALATGDYLLFLHSDDFLARDDVLEQVSLVLDNRYDIHAFDIIYRKGDADVHFKPRRFDWRTNFKTPYLHPGTLCHRRLFEAIGSFDPNFSIAMDYDFFIRAYRQGASEKYSATAISVMRDTGISSKNDWGDLRGRFAEEKRVQQKNRKSALMNAAYVAYWMVYLPFRWIRKAWLGY
jgi:glycosyltransferase involved in cell wall biosynthesis